MEGKYKIGQRVKCIEGGNKGAGWRLNRTLNITKISFGRDPGMELEQAIYWDGSGSGGVYESSLKPGNEWRGR